MMAKRTIALIGLAVIIMATTAFLTPFILNRLRWKMAAEAAGSYPITVGIAKANISNCILVPGTPPTCQGVLPTSPCAILTADTSQCVLYSDISGVSAGGILADPYLTPLLVSNIIIAKVGLNQSGQLIYGGTTNIMYSPTGVPINAVLASAGGCSGCPVVLKDNLKHAFINKVLKLAEDFKFIIAGKRESKK